MGVGKTTKATYSTLTYTPLPNVKKTPLGAQALRFLRVFLIFQALRFLKTRKIEQFLRQKKGFPQKMNYFKKKYLRNPKFSETLIS